MVEKLNSRQLEAVKASGGPVLIIAGAGSGKTSVLTKRIMYLINKKNVIPENILAVTFTNKAANEMKQRILNQKKSKVLGHNGNPGYNIWIGTFHAICLRILYQQIEYTEYNKRFTIYDKNETLKLIRDCLKKCDLDIKQYRPKAISYIIENAKNNLIDEDQYQEETVGFFNKTIAKLYKTYQEELIKNQALDYGGLIQKTVQLFQNNVKILSYYQKIFKHILVDEYQDINHAQYTLIRLLSEKNKNIFVVGDPDQSIYRFRGAELSNIINFEKDFPSCQIIKLEQNYRSSEMILHGASFLIRNNKYRKEKKLWTNRKGGEKIKYYEANSASDEAEFVAREIKNIVNKKKLNWSGIVILYRTNAQSRPFEEIFAKYDIPFKIVGGIRFFNRKEVKDLISILKLIENPLNHEYIRKWLEIFKFGIGPKGLEKIIDMANYKNKGVIDAMAECIETPAIRISIENKEKVKIHLGLFKYLHRTDKKNISSLVEKIVARIRYYDFLKNEYADDKIKIRNKVENIKSFIQSIKEYEKINPDNALGDYLNYISLISDTDNIKINSDGKDSNDMVHLMTLHCAKGLEFPVVFLTGLEEGIFPHNKSLTNMPDLEEERRLCYVGMTRAVDMLYLTYSWRRNVDGQTKFNKVSRFLSEIPAKYLENAKMMSVADSIYDKDQVNTKNVSFQVDNWIVHPDWGEGVIINKIEVGDDEYITVNFKTKGIKRLSVKYAPIKKMEKVL